MTAVALTDRFPSRLSSDWGGYRQLQLIPLRFGTVRGRCVAYQTADRSVIPGTRFVWSDGACAGVDRVWIDGQIRSGGWVALTRVDVTGRPVMMIEFAEPVDQDAEVTAEGRGQVRDGVLIRNPARVIAELARIAGVPVSGLDHFEVETGRLGIELSGEIADEMTVQGAIRSVCRSVGAVYSPRMRETALVYPGGTPELINTAPRLRAAIDLEHIVAADCDLGDIKNAVSVAYALRDGEPSKTMDLECPASIQAYGRRTGEPLRLEWIADPGIAANVATRIMQYLARPRYVVKVDAIRGELRPGDWISVDGDKSLAPFASGVRQMIKTEYFPGLRTSRGEFELWADPAPAVVITGQADIAEDQQRVSSTSTVVGDQRQVQLKGEGGRPLSGAKCVLDGTISRFADAGGVVTFPLADATPGPHDLTITIGTSITSSGTAIASDFGENNGDALLGTTGGAGGTSSGVITFTIRVVF